MIERKLYLQELIKAKDNDLIFFLEVFKTDL